MWLDYRFVFKIEISRTMFGALSKLYANDFESPQLNADNAFCF